MQETNPEIELAYRFIAETNKNIYLTGKAGTGKTTFLKRVRREIPKRMAVVAPTGVAAINAKGVTIHSLFQLPFGPIVPNVTLSGNNQRRFSKKKINLIKGIDLLIIDEISMVRADVLDGIDQILRKYKKHHLPFGGTQVLMIGDLHQLPPVVKDEEWNLLRGYYKSPYFFESLALKESQPITIHLKKIYRQQDETFINLLNHVRENDLNNNVLQQLNERYKENLNEIDTNGFITLTSHNSQADQINQEHLQKLSGKSFSFKASVNGDFPEYAFPTSQELTLKEGAQVMFVKNDISEERLYFNGKIGEVVSLENDKIAVACPGDDEVIEVEIQSWENRTYELNPETKEIEEKVLGEFKQFPLKLAWAITIHKSQGLTFDKVIIDAGRAFAHGQVYVALSRCTSLNGILLKSKIAPSAVKTDQLVSYHSKSSLQEQPGDIQLDLAKKEFQERIIIEILELRELDKISDQWLRLAQIHQKTIQAEYLKETTEWKASLSKEYQIAFKFKRELAEVFSQNIIPENFNPVVERLKKAGTYFTEKFEELLEKAQSIDVITDNREVEKTFEEKKKELIKQIKVSLISFKNFKEGLNAAELLKQTANIEIDTKETKKKVVVPKNIEHKDLYTALVEWRRNLASENGYPAYRVLSTKSILEIVHVLPTNEKALTKISGIGKVKLKEFGAEILEFVEDYLNKNSTLTSNRIEFATGKEESTSKKDKTPTHEISIALFREGKSPEKIAQKRDYALTTIEGHLAKGIEEGELNVFDFVKKSDVLEIVKYFAQADNESLKLAMDHFDEKYSYTDLRYARSHWKHQMSKV